jgi:hypothetical protein
MEQCPSKINSSTAGQEIPCILWIQKAHYRLYKNLQLVPILSQINPVYASISHFLNIRWNVILSVIEVAQPTYSLNFFSPHCVPKTSPILLSIILSRILIMYNG